MAKERWGTLPGTGDPYGKGESAVVNFVEVCNAILPQDRGHYR